MMDEAEQQRIFDDWMGRHKGLCFKVVRAYAFTHQDQQDLFQEIATQVWRSVPAFRGEAAESTWIYRVALYAAVAWSRGEKRHRTVREALNGADAVLLARPPGRDRRLDWLYERIARLDEIDRSLTLLLLDGFSYREMAATLGISESNVGVKINRLKSHLARMSQEENRHGL